MNAIPSLQTAESLETYVPRHVKNICTIDRTPGEHKEDDVLPFSDEDQNAAVALIDLSGYSKLTTNIAELLGNTGSAADVLKNKINPLFDKLVEVCVRHSGDIYKFAHTLLRWGNFSRNRCAVTLAWDWAPFIACTSVAMAASAWSRLEMLPSVTESVAGGGKRTKGSYVILGTELAERVVRGKGWTAPPSTGPAKWMKPGKTLAPWCKEYVNESTVHWLEANLKETQGGFNMLRTVSVVFAKFPLTSEALTNNVTDDAQRILAVTQHVMELIVHILEESKGTLRQLAVDDKGATALLVWGLPPYANQNDATHAIRAATAIKTGFREIFGDDFSIGVTSGSIFTGSIGNEARSDHSILGRAVNEAARLMCLPQAKGGVVCDAATHAITRSYFRFRRLSSQERQVILKGSSRPVEIFMPTSPRSTPKNENRWRAISSTTSPLPPTATVASPEKGTTKAGSAMAKVFDASVESLTASVDLIGRFAEKSIITQAVREWDVRCAANLAVKVTDGHAGGFARRIVLTGETGQGKSTLGEFFVDSLLQQVRKALPDLHEVKASSTSMNSISSLQSPCRTEIADFESTDTNLPTVAPEPDALNPFGDEDFTVHSSEPPAPSMHFDGDRLLEDEEDNSRVIRHSIAAGTRLSLIQSRTKHSITSPNNEAKEVSTTAAQLVPLIVTTSNATSRQAPAAGMLQQATSSEFSSTGAALDGTGSAHSLATSSLESLQLDPRDVEITLLDLFTRLKEPIENLALLNALLGCRFEVTTEILKLEEPDRQDVIKRMITRLLTKVPSAFGVPIAIMIDDVQEYPPETQPYIHSAIIHPYAEPITLLKLDVGSSERFILNFLRPSGVTKVDGGLLGAIHEKTDGNFLGLKIVCESLLLELQGDASKVVMTPLSPPTGTFSVQDGELASLSAGVAIDRCLPESSQLAMIPMYGQHFQLKTLWKVCVQRDERTMEILEDKYAFLRNTNSTHASTRVGGRATYSFRNGFIQKGIYHTITEEDKRSIHGSIVSVLMDGVAADDDAITTLSYHTFRAGLTEQSHSVK
ncbi:hypothetical protein HK101_004589 [Irineochytrium annulatum]|nr:hypothetical protein HK101_004589 [Irineochytrium annulatum]